jgi:hypothetical protein
MILTVDVLANVVSFLDLDKDALSLAFSNKRLLAEFVSISNLRRVTLSDARALDALLGWDKKQAERPIGNRLPRLRFDFRVDIMQHVDVPKPLMNENKFNRLISGLVTKISHLTTGGAPNLVAQTSDRRTMTHFNVNPKCMDIHMMAEGITCTTIVLDGHSHVFVIADGVEFSRLRVLQINFVLNEQSMDIQDKTLYTSALEGYARLIQASPFLAELRISIKTIGDIGSKFLRSVLQDVVASTRSGAGGVPRTHVRALNFRLMIRTDAARAPLTLVIPDSNTLRFIKWGLIVIETPGSNDGQFGSLLPNECEVLELGGMVVDSRFLSGCGERVKCRHLRVSSPISWRHWYNLCTLHFFGASTFSLGRSDVDLKSESDDAGFSASLDLSSIQKDCDIEVRHINVAFGV